MKSQASGFTLIELVVVITILGILAAFAVPKFIALDSQARIATINGLAGSVKSAASLARGMAMAMGQSGATGAVTMEGSAVNLANGYPDSTAAGIPMAVNTSASDFTYTPGAASGTWAKVGAPGVCTVTYTPAPAGGVPGVTTSTAGC